MKEIQRNTRPPHLNLVVFTDYIIYFYTYKKNIRFAVAVGILISLYTVAKQDIALLIILVSKTEGRQLTCIHSDLHRTRSLSYLTYSLGCLYI